MAFKEDLDKRLEGAVKEVLEFGAALALPGWERDGWRRCRPCLPNLARWIMQKLRQARFIF